MKTTLLKIIFLVIISVPAIADTQLFRAKIYEAQEILHTHKFGAFRETVGRLNIARELTDNSVSHNEVVAAIKLLANRNIEDNDLVKKVNAHLESALRNDRLKISSEETLQGESLETLLMTAMFGNAAEKINIKSNKFEKPQLLSLLLTYLTDPRSAKFDPDVKELVENKEISFVLPSEKVTLDEGIDKKVFVDELKAQMKMLTPEEAPITFKIKTSKTGEVIIEIEIKGMDAISFIETWVRNPLMMANGNRYMKGVADGVEGLSTAIKSQYLGHNTTLHKMAQAFATKVLDPAEEILRNKLISERWTPASVEIVKKQIEQQTAIKVEHIKKNLARQLERLNSTLGTEEEIAAAKARSEKYIANAEAKLKTSLGNIDNAVSELQKTEAYTKATPAQKSAMSVAAAEKAGNTKLWSWRRCLNYVTAVLSTYYVYEWAAQTYRNDDPKAQQAINEKYGVKLANTMMYFVPAVGELAFAVDFLGNWAMNFIFKAAEINFHVPSVETLLHKGIERVATLILEWRGIREFDIAKNEMLLALDISPFEDVNGVWWDANIVKNAGELKTNMNLYTTDEKRNELNKVVKTSAYRYLNLYYSLSSRFKGEHDDLGRFYQDLISQWKAPNSNFVMSGMSLL